MRGWCRILTLVGFLCGCSGKQEPAREGDSGTKQGTAGTAVSLDSFVDVTEESGVRFRHFNDASDRRYLPETMGSGVAFFDYDGDGRPDIYLADGTPLQGDRTKARPGVLFKNLDGRRFEDVTARAGITGPLYGMGVAVGDIDNDGRPDLLLTGLGGDRLYRNRGDSTFEDITRRAGFTDGGFSSSAAFLDYDRDGLLDLFLGRYVEWSPQSDLTCSLDGIHRIYCTPELYHGASNKLYRNLGGGRFEDVTRGSGVFHPEGKTLGVVVVDQNKDGWPDIAVANDTVRNFLLTNNRDGTFSENGVTTAMAYSDSGATRGGMGIDAADYDGDGWPDLVIGNFSKEMASLYRGSGRGYFMDVAAQSGVGIPTLMTLAFGTLFLDLDNDGRLDVVFVNGHIEPEIAALQPLQSFAQPPQFFRNEGEGRFRLLTGSGRSAAERPLVGRGLAAADLDGDGDLDLVITQNGREAVLLRNDCPPRSWTRIQAVASSGNSTPYGLVIHAVSGSQTWVRSLASGRSYLSASEPVLSLGLGATESLDRIELTWPSGSKQVLERPALNRVLTIHEP